MVMASKITVKEYLTALAQNKLLGLKCQDCGFVTTPPRLACRKCGGQKNEIVELSGKGKIVTFTAVHIAAEKQRGKTPFLVIMVELDEGPWIMGNISGVDSAAPTLDLIGKRVVMQNPPFPADQKPEHGVAPLFVLDI
jgi:uncharacterized protein